MAPSLVRANAEGIELFCRRFERRVIVPFRELQGKEHLVRYLDAWRVRAKRA